jgi:hypothetical protein
MNPNLFMLSFVKLQMPHHLHLERQHRRYLPLSFSPGFVVFIFFLFFVACLVAEKMRETKVTANCFVLFLSFFIHFV